MRLAELEAYFVRREIRACYVGAPGCSTVSEHTEHEYHVPVSAIEMADGVAFFCPKCWLTNGGPIGTHKVLCWRPHVPPDVRPIPGRWEFRGSSLDDLTLVAGSSSILLTGGGCEAHFFIQGGAIT